MVTDWLILLMSNGNYLSILNNFTMVNDSMQRWGIYHQYNLKLYRGLNVLKTVSILLGISKKARILIVCHCYRENDEFIRIISARKADRKEEKQYTRRL